MEKLLVTVDAIEGEKAALLLRCPEEELPEGVCAGDILSLSFHAEPELTEEARARVLALHKKLLRR